jgi:periplasmic divalent cation tolerance protein
MILAKNAYYFWMSRIVLTNTSSRAEARKIARTLVDRKLAACVNIIPKIESVYRWKGKVERAEEWLLMIKTTQRRVKAVESAIREMHSYELPECIVVPISGGSKDYLRWLEMQVK